MDAQRAEGIVLRKHPVTETSLIVTWYTHEQGQLKTMAKGARRPKGPFVGKIDLFYQDEILYLPSRRGELHLLTDCFLVKTRAALRESIERVTAASYACELVESITPLEDPQPKIFDLLAASLDLVATLADPRVLLIWLELQLLSMAGWKPQWKAGSGVVRLLGSLGEATSESVARVRLTAAQIESAREIVWRFWDGQVGRVPRSRNLFARQVHR